MMKKWLVYNKKADFKAIAAKFGIDQVTARILRNRDLITDEEIERYLNGDLSDLYSPLLLPDAIRCMNRLDRTIKEGKKIRIVGDYDVDGVMSTFILLKGLSRLSQNVDYIIPDRVRDGYGINRSIIEKAKEDGVEFIITCDNGISAIDELSFAGELGIDVVVTDHHDTRKGAKGEDILPLARAVVNAKRQGSRYPFQEICGAVVAWKVIQLLYEKLNIPKEEADQFLDFAAVATICDVVKLKDENRIIARLGLKELLSSNNLGMQTLIKVSGLDQQESISAYHVGFVIGPMINAGGRLESAECALKLFLTEDPEEANSLAEHLKALNDARKDMTKRACEEAYEQVEKYYRKDPVLLVYLPSLHESLAGIVAGRVREKYYRPSFVVTNASPEADQDIPMAKGSGRSIEGYPMSERLAEAAGLLTKFGGHPMAAGFSLHRDKVNDLRNFLNEHSALSKEQLIEKLWIDVPMPIDYIREDLITEFEKLSPFGSGNPKPVFACKGLKILSVRVLGRMRNAVRLDLLSSFGTKITGMLFMDGDIFLKEREGKKVIDIVYYPLINVYQDRRSIQVQIQDYILS